ncbi:sensor histidine kinase [Dactylosporangium aurantiacum]|uniref:histidine kinase n=1 Tax=Dactylosporangium aurantiacum TaxID=35754 RepID=A0A9Q9ID41_9ACTN|nr:histidine kinase [Dactylosporangium aurantiacum]MDG6102674.1 histidine kinase [Dactylosporangium aurantiacum]UWZ53076.1 sensor histidine kinase [Dactylosporangium aurantiacum]
MTWLRGVYRSGVLLGAAVVVLAQFLLSVLVMAPGVLLGLVFLIPPPVLLGRRLTNRWRAVFAGWTGRAVPEPYLPPPPPPEPDSDGMYRHDTTLYRTPRFPRFFGRLDWLMKDPATKRDLVWQLWFPFVVLAVVPVGLVVAPWAVRLVATWSAWMLSPMDPARAARRGRRSARTQRALLAWARAALLVCCAALEVPLLAFSLACFALGYGLGLIFLIPVGVAHFRWLANLRREFAGWGGQRVQRPYTPQLVPQRRPDGLLQVRNNLYKTEAMAAFNARWLWTWSDVATWRDLVWLAVDPVVTVALLGPPVVAAVYGAFGLALPWLWTTLFGAEWSGWYGAVDGSRTAGLVAGVALVAAAFATVGWLVRVHARWTALLLRPTREAALRLRVEQLTRSRADAVDAQAAELRRIERDLHDGAQARLIAVGLTLGAIERLMDTDPAAARRLVTQTKETAEAALRELRDLVRGIHPPVLSERGLTDAVRALALDTAADVTVDGGLAGRPPAPVESAAYFAVSELIANATRHGGADRIRVTLHHGAGLLRVTVTDDGAGGADPSRGTGLRGIERRLGTFDGTLVLSSPPGGPTVATLELPCVLSSPKTSTC